MKRWIACLLAVVLLLSTGVMTAFAEEEQPVTEAQPAPQRAPGYCGENLQWSYAEGVLSIDGIGFMDDFPNGAPWASYKSEIQELRLGDGVSTIGAHAFQDYDALKTVKLGSGLSEIGTAAFSGCDGLTEMDMPVGFRVFGEESFSHCKNLKEIRFQGGMPKFKLNCMWDTYTKLIYPAGNPWPLQHIEQLESAFQGRIEFLSSDGTDPLVPQEETPTQAPTEAPTEAPTLAPTTEPATAPTEAPTEKPPVTEATVPETKAPTQPQQEQTVPATTEEYVVLPEPEEEETSSGISIWVIGLIALMVLSGGGALLLVARMSHNKKKDFTGDFSEILLQDEKKPKTRKPTTAQKTAAGKTRKKGGKYSK